MTAWKQLAGCQGAWTGDYDFGGNPITMLVVDLGERRLAVFSPGTGVDEAAFSALEGLGEVAALVSPGAFHNMGLPTWHGRFPKARLFATASGLRHIAKQHKDLPPLEGLDALRSLAGDRLTLIETAGKHEDLIAFYRDGEQVVCFNNEALGNWLKLPGNPLFAFLFWAFDAAPGLKLNRVALMLLGAKRREVAGAFAAAVRAHGADVFVPCHGAVLDGPGVKDKLLAVLDAAAR